jgi:hypothetical protein|tara:strand:+ start:238 stop:555 length:318 start_codon:yes stop_codon:yes gene_type:complete
MGMTPEGKIKQKIDKLLKRKGIWFFKPQAGPYGRSGVPDYIVCARGAFIGIEAKSDKTKKPTALQTQCMEKIVGGGGKCFVVYDQATLEHVEDALAILENLYVSH